MIICRKCKTENDANQNNCRNCNEDLLPGRSPGYRMLFFAIALGSLGLLIVAFSFGTIVAKTLFAIPLAAGLFGGLGLALGKTSLMERYKLRGEQHIKKYPEQAVNDFNNALQNLKDNDDGSKYELIEKRGEAYFELEDFSNALIDFEASEKYYKQENSSNLEAVVIKKEKTKAKLAKSTIKE